MLETKCNALFEIYFLPPIFRIEGRASGTSLSYLTFLRGVRLDLENPCKII